jgi:hypothetical protein
MNKIIKQSLFSTVVGLCLFVVISISATGKNTETLLNQQSAMKEQITRIPAAANVAVEQPKISFAFCLSLVTSFINGTYIDFYLVGEGDNQPFGAKSQCGKGRNNQLV